MFVFVTVMLLILLLIWVFPAKIINTGIQIETFSKINPQIFTNLEKFPIHTPRLYDNILYDVRLYEYDITDLDYHIVNNDVYFDEGFLITEDLDSQNVHDTKVQRSIKQKYLEISDNVNDDMLKFIKENRPDEYLSIKIIIEDIYDRDTYISSLEETEKQVLDRVWNACEGYDSKDAFVQNLKDCLEDGKLVCATGVTSRLVSTLFLDKPEEHPKTESMIFSEILSKCSMLRNDYPEEEFGDKLMECIRNDYNLLTEEEILRYHSDIMNNL